MSAITFTLEITCSNLHTVFSLIQIREHDVHDQILKVLKEATHVNENSNHFTLVEWSISTMLEMIVNKSYIASIELNATKSNHCSIYNYNYTSML